MEPQKECAHFWIIDTPDGPVSTGRCKFCGETREFKNVWTESFNEHQVTHAAEKNQEKIYA